MEFEFSWLLASMVQDVEEGVFVAALVLFFRLLLLLLLLFRLSTVLEGVEVAPLAELRTDLRLQNKFVNTLLRAKSADRSLLHEIFLFRHNLAINILATLSVILQEAAQSRLAYAACKCSQRLTKGDFREDGLCKKLCHELL